MTTPLDELVSLLDLETVEQDIFRGKSPDTSMQRIFGGQVAGQALVAAGRTVPPDRHVHSLHAYFLRPGDPAVPVVYLVDRIRDGRSFTTRRVVGVQHGKAIFNVQASFQVLEQGVEHADPMPDVPAPETLPSLVEQLAPYGGQLDAWLSRPRPIDLRYVGAHPMSAAIDGRPHEASSQVWMRADGTLPDDPLLHVCALTYASDMSLLDSVLLPHGMAWQTGTVSGASLDHAMWFHRPFRADHWLLYAQHSAAAAGGRGLAEGRFFTRDGQLVVSVVQEGLVRRRSGETRN
ncbi:MAG TPA: acyl-CoA thioesterase II [Mycobacteriales bacterium]|nr:acyl-CoA thioesterase II [Mycobacteriales bacterium]